MIWDEFLRHFCFCDEEDSGLSDEEQERKGPKNRPKHTRKRIHQAKKNFLEKFKTASKFAVLFKVFAGCSFSQYIQNCRLDYAVRLMREQPQWTLDAIAKEAQMSKGAFNIQFHKRYGMKPSEFRSRELSLDEEK